ncbi:MAG: polysaccharide deacetylase family protein, partial [Siculibacillus sp.]
TPPPTQPVPWVPSEKRVVKGSPAARVDVPDYDRLPVVAPLAPALRGSIRRVDLPPGEKLVALTFDLCETASEVAGYDGEIVDELRRRAVPTTFFVGGHWAVTHPGRFAELAADPLFEIANHTWTHANLRFARGEDLARQLLAPEAAFLAGGVRARSTLLRFPFGACDPVSLDAAAEAGLAAIQWDVSTGDPSPATSAEAIVAQTLAAVRPGSIVLAHANGRGFHTGAALPRVLDGLAARGYRFVTVGELLKRGRPVVAATCYDGRPGDTDRYGPFGLVRATTGPAAPTAPAPLPLRKAVP